MNICIAGSRNIIDRISIYSIIEQGMIRLCKDKNNITFVLGGAKGVDTIAEEYVKSGDYNIIKILPDWNTHGKKAGYLRNAEMIKISDGLIAIWDGVSNGTKHTINLANNKQIPTYVVTLKD